MHFWFYLSLELERILSIHPNEKRNPGLGVYFPQSEYRDLSAKAFGSQTNNQALACCRGLQHMCIGLATCMGPS